MNFKKIFLINALVVVALLSCAQVYGSATGKVDDKTAPAAPAEPTNFWNYVNGKYLSDWYNSKNKNAPAPPPPEAAAVVDPATAPVSTDTANKDEGGSMMWTLLLVGGGAVIIVGGIIAYIQFTKSSEDSVDL